MVAFFSNPRSRNPFSTASSTVALFASILKINAALSFLCTLTELVNNIEILKGAESWLGVLHHLIVIKYFRRSIDSCVDEISFS